jgi:dTDP-4-dehydrorhamnose reductase
VIELWGGVECTINRVGAEYFDQLARCGHYDRLDDLDRFAALGIRTLRWPALWERIAPLGPDSADWRWCDAALARLRDLGIEPIVGLVHHGSGPSSTHLLDPAFVDGLAAYARAFAERYPWVRRYTPINEPLTTARFSALYGHWYPHRRDDRAFVEALIHQCRASVAAMEQIRAVNPEAGVVLTEDAGFTGSTAALASQAAFENERRWASIDLVLGRLDADHPMWPYLSSVGMSDTDREWFREHAIQPDTIGLNYYVTSDRFLDERLERYPSSTHGGNGRIRYADIEAVRVEGVGARGHADVLTEVWNRYRLPVAITEAHLGCTRENQMRWLLAAWDGAHDAARRGADVRAVTAWALLGSWDWDSLVTRQRGRYEPGLFDARDGSLRPTAVATVAKALAAGRRPEHPVLEAPGWWLPSSSTAAHVASTAPILIIGATGTLGRACARACEQRRLAHVLLSRSELDIVSLESVRGAIARYRPWAVINAAGYVRVDDAEREPQACRQVNAVGPAILALACRKAGVRLLTFSSDLVFDGEASRPYVETDAVGPLNIYGHTKAEAERRVLAFDPSALVVRTSAFFGPRDQYNFLARALDAITARRPFRAPSDTTVSPTYVPDLVDACLDLLIDGGSGVWHVANAGAVTWADFARRAARIAGFDEAAIDSCTQVSLGLAAPRPIYSALASAHGRLLGDLDESIERFLADRRVA